MLCLSLCFVIFRRFHPVLQYSIFLFLYLKHHTPLFFSLNSVTIFLLINTSFISLCLFFLSCFRQWHELHCVSVPVLIHCSLTLYTLPISTNLRIWFLPFPASPSFIILKFNILPHLLLVSSFSLIYFHSHFHYFTTLTLQPAPTPNHFLVLFINASFHPLFFICFLNLPFFYNFTYQSISIFITYNLSFLSVPHPLAPHPP